MNIQLAETSAERLVGLDRDVLVPEEEHQVCGERVAEHLEALIVECAEIDPVDFGADRGREGMDDQGPTVQAEYSFARTRS